MGRVANIVSLLILTPLLLAGGILMILSYVQLRKNEEEAKGSRAKGRQYAAISCSMLIIVAIAVVIVYGVVEFYSVGKV